MKRLALPQVTLVAVDTRAPALATQALQRSIADVDFARAVLFTHPPASAIRVAGIEVVDCGLIDSGAAYSQFVLRKLPSHVHTSHVLVTQWDGFVVDAAAWTDEFLTCDYVGAVWPDQPAAVCVGNGGFSLRSRRLLDAGLDARIVDEHPEDQMLCRENRALLVQTHGVRFASPALARRFAFENEAPRGPTFGFHGAYNLPRFIDEATLVRWIDDLPDAFFRGRDARRLARSLLRHGMPATARQVVDRRLSAGQRDLKTRTLAMITRWLAGAKP
jgi:hypothetical protein